MPSILEILSEGEIKVEGQFMWGSNYTFLADIQLGDESLAAVYKPAEGERPLWDFPNSTLAHREVAAYLVSSALNWNFVPPTVYRQDGPAGGGSLQLYIDHDPEYHFFAMRTEDRQKLRPVALFDSLINNADRKGGHILVDNDGQLWLIDHGLCFHEEEKLRTVIWDFAGEPIPQDLLQDMAGLLEKITSPSEFADQLAQHLTMDEIAALCGRVEWLLKTGAFPNPPEDRRPYPWPPV